MSPNAGGGAGWIAGSRPISTAVHIGAGTDITKNVVKMGFNEREET